MSFGNIFRNIQQAASFAAPILGAGAALSTGGQAATLARAATAAGVLGSSQQGQAVAVDRAAMPPAESASSGERGPAVTNVIATQQPNPLLIDASYGMNVPAPAGAARARQASLPAIISGGSAAARTIGGMLGLAGGAMMIAPLITDPLTGEQKKLRVTRKLKSQVKKAVEMFGVEFVAEQMGTDVEVVVYILTKRMRNDGPYVTKAAVRKTRSTIRKMKSLCDMYDDLRPAARRRAPARKTMSTRITNVK